MPTITIGGRIKEFRFGRDWTQEQMALHCGVSRGTIQRAEAGTQLAARMLFKLEQILKKGEQ